MAPTSAIHTISIVHPCLAGSRRDCLPRALELLLPRGPLRCDPLSGTGATRIEESIVFTTIDSLRRAHELSGGVFFRPALEDRASDASLSSTRVPCSPERIAFAGAEPSPERTEAASPDPRVTANRLPRPETSSIDDDHFANPRPAGRGTRTPLHPREWCVVRGDRLRECIPGTHPASPSPLAPGFPSSPVSRNPIRRLCPRALSVPGRSEVGGWLDRRPRARFEGETRRGGLVLLVDFCNLMRHTGTPVRTSDPRPLARRDVRSVSPKPATWFPRPVRLSREGSAPAARANGLPRSFPSHGERPLVRRAPRFPRGKVRRPNRGCEPRRSLLAPERETRLSAARSFGDRSPLLRDPEIAFGASARDRGHLATRPLHVGERLSAVKEPSFRRAKRLLRGS